MSPKKIIRVLMISGRADFGGGPEHVYQLTKAIGQSARVHIACPREEPYWTRYTQLLGPEFMTEIPHRRFSVKALLGLVRYIQEDQIDIVHAHGRAAGIYGRIAALMTGRRCCYTPHGGTPVKSLKTLCFAFIEYLLSWVTNKVIAVSATEGKNLRWLCSRRSQLAVIPNGVEIPSEPTTREARLHGPLCILHATRFVFQKNSEMLIDIIQRLRELGELKKFHFTILGDGPGRAEFEGLVRCCELEDIVSVEGSVLNPGDYMAGSDCLVSTSRWEGLPLVVLEAMARGIPVVATDVIGNSDAVVHGETGFLYDQASPERAATWLVQLADHPELRERLSCGARHFAEKEFSVEAMARSTLALYSDQFSLQPHLNNPQKAHS